MDSQIDEVPVLADQTSFLQRKNNASNVKKEIFMVLHLMSVSYTTVEIDLIRPAIEIWNKETICKYLKYGIF